MFLGEGSDAAEMLAWTSKLGISVVAVSGDEIVKERAVSLHISFYEIEELYEIVDSRKFSFDLTVSFLYGKILPYSFIQAVRYGCINFHPAPLPDYKGRAGCSFAILDKLNEWGCTAHYIDAGIDTGNIISVKRFPIEWKTETGVSLKRKTVDVLKELYREVLNDVLEEDGAINSTCQQSGSGRYVSKKDMLEAMEIKPGDDVDAKIQAFWFPPHEGAYITVNHKRYMLINDFVMREISRKLRE